MKNTLIKDGKVFWMIKPGTYISMQQKTDLNGRDMEKR